MDELGTVLAVSRDASEWADTLDHLSAQYGYRVLDVRTPADAQAALADVHVDLALAEDDGGGEGLSFLSALRISHPDIIRILVLDMPSTLARQSLSPAAIYQFLRKPLGGPCGQARA